MTDLNDIFREEEERRLEEAKREIAAETAAHSKLTEEQREALREAYEAKWGHLDDLPEDEEE